ncbi:MAG: type III secretion system gatekeeper subunit SctW [Chromatiales bacterium]|nr:type III secretion system gatekeeper subunit SctW [Chromatiales bacterium]
MSNINNKAVAPPLPSGTLSQSSGSTAQVDGSYRGQTISLAADPVELLEDAAEELTFAHSEKVEKKLAKREIGKKQELKSFAQEQAERYLKQVPDLEKNKKLAAFAKQIAQLEAQTAPEKLREYAEQSYNDVSHQFLALSYTRDLLQAQGADSTRIENLNKSIEQLKDQHGSAIRAGINISKNANDTAHKGVGDIQGLRDLYRDVVLDYASITQAYERVVKDYKGESFTDAVDFVLGGLVTEAGEDNRSLPKTQLKAIMDDIYQLKLLGSMYHQCDGLMDKVHSNYQTALAHGGQALLKEILTLKEKGWYSDSTVENIADQLDVNPVQARIYFLNGLKDVVRLIPRKAFEDENKRAELIGSIQQALDATIDKEFGE